MTNKKFYITTPIYYPSGRFHIGTAYTTILADTIARYKKMQNYDVYFLTGVDEHGQKIAEVAEKAGKTPQEHVEDIAVHAKELWKKLKIENDDFIRTTEKRHIDIVEKIFQFFLENGDIYKGEYEGKYCVPCEGYFTDTQLIDGKCPECGREVKMMKEETYFFNMKKYADRLKSFYEENPNFIVPESRKNELFNNFIEPGLEDLSVTRTTFDWGIQVPNDPKHTIYVWLDALTNYITAIGYLSETFKGQQKFTKYWPADLHIVGKDIIRFHALYWPVFLMALDLPLPKQIYAHGFITMKDGKMSKSKGNVVYPEVLSDRYGVDALRYFLLKEFPYGQDCVFSPEGFVERFNTDLCNDLGNLLNRSIAMINKYSNGLIPIYDEYESEISKDLQNTIAEEVKKFHENMDSLNISNALSNVWNIIARTNKYIDETTPWILDKEGKKVELISAMYYLGQSLRKVAVLLTPFMPDTAKNMFKQLGIGRPEHKSMESLESDEIIPGKIKVIQKGIPLFLRLDVEEEVKYIKNNMS